ncbi:hypothetical protein ACHQM5_003185 [Ranunculus cassubicifolius]
MAKTKRQVLVFLLRLVSLVGTVIAAIVMATSRETANVLSFEFKAKYDDVPAFKFFVIANVVASVYTLLVLFQSTESSLWRLIVALDVIVTMLLTGSISAALAISYVGKKGNDRAGWFPICDQIPKFCNQASVALISGFIAVVIYLILVLHSIHTVLNHLLV